MKVLARLSSIWQDLDIDQVYVSTVLGGSGGISRGGVKALVPADVHNLKDVEV